MSPFDRQIAASTLPLLLQQFGVRGVYRPKGRVNQSPREVYALCRPDEIAPDQDATGERQRERLWITCWRDVGRGIDAPELGDGFQRSELDPEDAQWSFQGEVRNETSVCWELLFARIRPRRYGPKTN